MLKNTRISTKYGQLLIVCCVLVLASHVNASYKLNVPKVLLPFHSSKLISFTLEAKSETDAKEELCFNWSSSRPDIVAISPIYNDAKTKCSSKAVVSAVSKHPQRLTSIIFAQETKTDKLIRCDVIVDQIDSIRIKHTTTHLYLEDSPECFTAEALDDEGNTFSSIDGLAFEWNVINELSDEKVNSLDSRNVLRISKFIDSEYEMSESIKQLESVGLSGHKILIEGLKTGTANVQAKLIDTFYKDTLKTPLVRLLVVANILLEPSYPVYLLQGGVIKYSVFLIKQTSVEKINLPQSQYYFESRNSTIADLVPFDKSASTMIGLALGTTQLVLVDRNMKEELLSSKYTDQSQIVPPPSATIHVVEPDYLVFTIKNWRSWILEVGRRYEIVIQVYSTSRIQIYPSDNLLIEAFFEPAKFDVNFQTRNGSYNYLTAIRRGVTQARALLKGTFKVNQADQLANYDWVARGEQEIELLDPIDVKPRVVIFALTPAQSSPYEYRLTATGGSGNYHWQSRNTSIAGVNNQGLIRTSASRVGHTQILITDARNQDISAKSNVYVLEPVDLSVQSCPVETQVNSKLYVNIQMNAQVNAASIQDDDLHIIGAAGSRLMPINDCSRLKFDIQIKDDSVFKFVSIESPSSVQDGAGVDACAVIVLDALKVGRTMIKVTVLSETTADPIELKSNEMYLGSYSELKSVKHQLTLSERSSYVVQLFDGPLLSSSLAASSTNPLLVVESDYKISTVSYESETSVSEPDTVSVSAIHSDHQPNRYSFRVECLRTFNRYADAANNFVTVRLSVSHRKSHMNKCPLPFDVRLKVRCAEPHSLELSQLFVNNEENTNSGNVLSTLKWKCPIKLSAQLITAHHERPLLIQTVARDSLNNPFDNFTSLPIEWTVEHKQLLEKSKQHSRLQHVQVAKNDDSSLVIVADDSIVTSNILYYQTFTSRSHLGGSSKLTAQLASRLTSTLTVNFVSDVKVKPESLTVFNHPSNVISLALLDGSGYYQAEIETINMDPSTSFNPKWDQTKLGNVLKINQITESSVVISPLVNNGLTYLHIYDYCVPPKSALTDGSLTDQRTVITWPPYATAKIQVAGINSILADYEDDKLEVSNRIRIYVQISDATGNLIKTKYFSLMNLNAKLSNVEMGKSDPIATVELAPAQQQVGEYTAVYMLNAHKVGLVSVQFEANSDGYVEDSAAAGKTSQTVKIIQSGLKEIQVYSPLVVQPKYIELVRGAEYQLIISGGPTSVDSTIKYEIADVEKNFRNDRIVEIESANSVVKALELGKVKVTVKAVGTACQPFSDSVSASASSRCSAENTIERVYSQDQLVVNVVELHSINLHAPLRSIKKGNEMPVYMMANEKKLSPLNFASCASLKYSWKINDQQIASLHHVLLPAAGDLQKASQNADEFEKSVSLRLLARNAGTVKITARVEFKNSKNQLITLSDTIDILVFDDAYFTNLPMSYFKLKHQTVDPLAVTQPDAQILMSPGTQFQLQTNYDKKAVRINYELKFYKQFFVNYELNKPSLCENSTIRINSEGLITVAPMKQSQLKHLQECTASVLVTIYQNEHHKQVKHQTLVYTVKVKPVVYSMLRLVRNSIYKSSDVFNAKLKIDHKSLIRNKLQLSDASVESKWHVCYFDNLGDMFDVVSLTNVYAVNRNDLVDFSNLNANVFVSLYGSTGKLAAEDKANGGESQPTVSSITLLADAAENSFTLRTIKPGTHLMELGMYEGGLHDFKDYLGLNIIADKQYDANLESIEKKSHVETNVGDLICLNRRSDSDEVECAQTVWSSESSQIVRLISVENQAHLTIGICVAPGVTFVKKSNAQVDASISALIEVNVKSFDRVKFLTTKSPKHLTNAHVDSDRANLIHFQVGQNQQDLNCSSEFELLFGANRQQSANNELVPFKCVSSIYGQNGKRLDYLDRLFVTNVVFVDQQWACEIRFAPNAASTMYELLDSHQPDEPLSLRLAVDAKQAEISIDDPVKLKTLSLPFVPAFHVSTKQIELTVFGNTIRRKQPDQENHVHLTIHSTAQLHSHLLVSSNCPSLIQIKQAGGEANSVSYDITPTDEILDLTGYASLLQELKGDLHVQVTCPLTQQVLKIPVKFIFAFGSDASRLDYRLPHKPAGKTYPSEPGYFYNLIGWIFDYSPNQFTTFCIMISITLLTILVILRLKSPTSTSAAEQIALNASAAAAAALTGSAYRQSPGGNIRNLTSFNPYRYFTQSVDANSQLDYSRLASSSPGFRSPKQAANATLNSSFNDSFSSASQPSQSRSPRLFDKDQIRLYSVDSTVSQKSPRYQDDTFHLSQRFPSNPTHRTLYRNMDNSFSDNE